MSPWSVPYCVVIVPWRKADVASKAIGRLEALEVKEGSRVMKGQVIARLENGGLLAAADRALANMALTRAEVVEARARAQALANAGKSAQAAATLEGAIRHRTAQPMAPAPPRGAATPRGTALPCHRAGEEIQRVARGNRQLVAGNWLLMGKARAGLRHVEGAARARARAREGTSVAAGHERRRPQAVTAARRGALRTPLPGVGHFQDQLARLSRFAPGETVGPGPDDSGDGAGVVPDERRQAPLSPSNPTRRHEIRELTVWPGFIASVRVE